jgi:hypothetical protein
MIKQMQDDNRKQISDLAGQIKQITMGKKRAAQRREEAEEIVIGDEVEEVAAESDNK